MLPNALVSPNWYLLTAFDIAGRLTFWKREKIFVRFSSCWGIPIWKQHRPAVEVADILRAQGNSFIDRHRGWLRFQQIKVMRAILRCRTAALGGHVDKCLRCGKDWGLSFNSCRDRHCPKCQAQSRHRWIAARQEELLATPYFHVVFTLP